jgi:hypothetical protein
MKNNNQRETFQRTKNRAALVFDFPQSSQSYKSSETRVTSFLITVVGIPRPDKQNGIEQAVNGARNTM